METIQGISLNSYFHLKPAKTPFFKITCFFFNKTSKQEGGTGSAQRGRRRGK
jgi:hypothetical protein